MTPAARVQTSIELLDSIIEAARSKGAPADRILAEWFRNNRFAGSKDRRAIRELVFAAIRACGPMPASGRSAMLRLGEVDENIPALFDGSNYGPAAIRDGESAAAGGVAPEWLEQRLAASDVTGQETEALLERAPLDLRVNTLKADRATLELPAPASTTAAPNGLRVEPGTQVEQWPAFRDGAIEVQDTGSQLACMAVAAQPGETVIDLCAGGGGKTLALAAAMDNLGRLIASDTDRNRLSRLAPRAERAGATNIQTILLNPAQELDALADFTGQADAVLGQRHLAAQSRSPLASRRKGTGPPHRNPVLPARSSGETRQARRSDRIRHLLSPGRRGGGAVRCLSWPPFRTSAERADPSSWSPPRERNTPVSVS